MKDIWLKKWSAVSIILLFIGIAVAPSINQSVVRAAQDDNLVEVTTQACGIKGYGNNTVKLTRQQYNDLEQYLVEFRARLNQTSTRGEAIPIFKDAVVELDKYGLLPRGMSVENEFRFLTLVNQGYENLEKLNIFSKIFESNYVYINVFCFLVLYATDDVLEASLLFLPLDFVYLLVIMGEFFTQWKTFFSLLLEGVTNLYNITAKILYRIPVKFWINLYGTYDEIWSIGLKGYKHSKINYDMYGFKGLRVILPNEIYYIGHALAIGTTAS